MTACEDCGDEVIRRFCCFHCGLYICPWCWDHVHRCEPGHSRAECWCLRLKGKEKVQFLGRARQLMLEKQRVEMKAK